MRCFAQRLRPYVFYRPAGFTLVELLVVIAIIGILVALLLPAIQAAREAARRSSCQNGVRNLALAALNYENQRKGLPPAVSTKPNAGERWQEGRDFEGDLSWIVRILPLIEEQTLYDQFDLTKTIQLQRDALVQKGNPQAAQPQILLCPSDGSLGRYYVAGPADQVFPNGRFGKTNYAAYVSPEHVINMRIFPGALSNEPQRLSKIIDGTSKTLMISEVRARDVERDPRGAWAAAWAGGSILAYDMHSALHQDATLSSKKNSPYSPFLYGGIEPGLPPNTSQSWGNLDYIRECPFEGTAGTVDFMPCKGTASQPTRQSAAPRSQHPGGVNASNVDGSTVWIADDIDIFLMARMVSINDSEGLREGRMP